MMALQPNQKIKNPHPPADWKTVADISAKHRVHGGRKPQDIARRQENFDELLRVPSVHEAEINIHRPVDRCLIAHEKPVRLARTIKGFIKRIGGKFAAEHGEENATAKNWIDRKSVV